MPEEIAAQHCDLYTIVLPGHESFECYLQSAKVVACQLGHLGLKASE